MSLSYIVYKVPVKERIYYRFCLQTPRGSGPDEDYVIGEEANPVVEQPDTPNLLHSPAYYQDITFLLTPTHATGKLKVEKRQQESCTVTKPRLDAGCF